MLKCPNCGSENVDHCYSTDEIEIWCQDCKERDIYYLPSPREAFPTWNVDDEDEWE